MAANLSPMSLRIPAITSAAFALFFVNWNTRFADLPQPMSTYPHPWARSQSYQLESTNRLHPNHQDSARNFSGVSPSVADNASSLLFGWLLFPNLAMALVASDLGPLTL